MATLDQIKSEIKTIAESVTGIGKIFAYLPHITSLEKITENLVSNDKVNVLFFTFLKQQHDNTEDYKPSEFMREWRFELYYGYEDGVSEAVFDNLLVDLMSKFNSLPTLNDKVGVHTPLDLNNDKGYDLISNVLCHKAILSFETTE